MFNNATMVAMMRDDTLTVMSMQNNYQGPPEDFALIVPVPVVLQEENVKTLERALFERIDRLAAPRLVEVVDQAHRPAGGSDQRRAELHQGVRAHVADLLRHRGAHHEAADLYERAGAIRAGALGPGAQPREAGEGIAPTSTPPP